MGVDIELVGLVKLSVSDKFSCVKVPAVYKIISDLGHSTMRGEILSFADRHPHLLLESPTGEDGFRRFWIRSPAEFIVTFQTWSGEVMEASSGWEEAKKHLHELNPDLAWWIHFNF